MNIWKWFKNLFVKNPDKLSADKLNKDIYNFIRSKCPVKLPSTKEYIEYECIICRKFFNDTSTKYYIAPLCKVCDTKIIDGFIREEELETAFNNYYAK